MYKCLLCLRWLGLFPRSLRKENGGPVVGSVSVPHLLFSVAIMTSKLTMLVNQGTTVSPYMAGLDFAQFLSLFLWNFTCVVAETVIIATLLLKHRKLCRLVQILSKFEEVVHNTTTLTKEQKLIVSLRILIQLISICAYIKTQSYPFTNFGALITYYSSFFLLQFFQIFTFMVTNTLGAILGAVVLPNGQTIYEIKRIRISLEKLFRWR